MSMCMCVYVYMCVHIRLCMWRQRDFKDLAHMIVGLASLKSTGQP